MLKAEQLSLEELDLIGEYLTTPSDKNIPMRPQINAELEESLHVRLLELLSSTKRVTTREEWKEIKAIYLILNTLRDQT